MISWSKVAAVSGVSLSKSTPSWEKEFKLESAVAAVGAVLLWSNCRSVTGGEGDRFAAILSTKMSDLDKKK